MFRSRRMHHRSIVARSFVRVLAVLGALASAGNASAEVFRKEDMLRGITISREQCIATEQALWLSVHGRDFCVRYYISTAGGEGPRPVVFLRGDQRVKLDLKAWSWLDTSEVKDTDTDAIMRTANGFSELAKTTAIYLSRPGLDGTSGNHTSRHTLLELQLMNAALDAIKQRHGFEGFHLAGQSGGSKLVGGLIGLRRDIACAVIGSGPLAPPSGGVKSADPGRTFFDPNQNISKVVQDRALRPILLTDKADTTVPVAQQTGYADRLRKAGRPIPQLFVQATDEHHHGVVSYAQLAAGGCVLGRSDEEITRAVSVMVKRNSEYNQRRQNEDKDKAAIQAAARQPAEGLAAAGKK